MSARACLSAAAALVFGAMAAMAQEAAPAWRSDLTHLQGDRSAIVQCLAGATDDHRCIGVVQSACAEAAASIPREGCEFRAIAAWEDEGEAMASTLRAALPPTQAAELERAQEFWRRSLAAELGLAARTPSGASGEAALRARAVAERAVYLRGRVRQLDLR